MKSWEMVLLQLPPAHGGLAYLPSQRLESSNIEMAQYPLLWRKKYIYMHVHAISTFTVQHA